MPEAISQRAIAAMSKPLTARTILLRIPDTERMVFSLSARVLDTHSAVCGSDGFQSLYSLLSCLLCGLAHRFEVIQNAEHGHIHASSTDSNLSAVNTIDPLDMGLYQPC
jgi:hypothetical protein